MSLNDVDFPIDSEENLGKVLIDNLGKITVHDFTFHINCLIPFHTGYWDKLFIIRFLRNWKIFAFGKEFSSEDEFDKMFFRPLLRFDNIDLIKEYKLVYNDKSLEFNESNEIDMEMKELLTQNFSFLFSVDTFVRDYKLSLARNKKYLHYFLENEGLIALLSQNSFTEIISLIKEEGIISDFINTAFVKCLQLAAPSLIPSYIMKTQDYSKYLNLDSLGFLYHYTQMIYKELEEYYGKTSLTKTEFDTQVKPLAQDLSKNFQKHKEKQEILLKAQRGSERHGTNLENFDNESNLKTKIFLWKLSSFKDINLSSNLFLSSLSSKFNVEKMIVSYWKRFKLQPPVIFFQNSHIQLKNNPLNFKITKTINIKKQLISYYKKSRNVLTQIELSNVDDIFGEIILELVSQLPAVKRLQVCNLNLGDNFCLGLSDYLIERRIRKLSTGIHFDLSKNLRISNVGLKFLYVGMEFSAFEGSLDDVKAFDDDKKFTRMPTRRDSLMSSSLNKWMGKENYDSPSLMIDETIKSNATFILDHGLGVFLEEMIYSYTGPQKFYCENCEEFVCSKCHKFWSLHTINKKCNDIDQTIDFDINECKEFNNQMKKAKRFQHLTNVIYDFIRLVWLLQFLCFILKYVILFSRWLASKFEAINNKIMKFIFGDNNGPPSKSRRCTCYQKFKHFLFGHDSDPDFDIDHFSYHINVTTVDNYLHKKWIVFTILTGFVSFVLISVLVPLYTGDISNYIAILVYLLLTIVVEIYLMARVIKLLNRGMRKKIVPSFSLLNYGQVLLDGAAERFDAFSDFMFINEAQEEGNLDLVLASVVILALVFVIYAIQVLITLKKLRSRDMKRGKANSNINLMSRLCIITENKGLASLLDVYSTRNAVKIFGKFYPQIIISSSIKFFIENLPQFVIQLIHVFRSDITTVVAISLAFTIYGSLSALVTTLNAKASVLTKTMILKKFSEKNVMENLAEDNERIHLVVESENVENETNELSNLGTIRPLTERTTLIKREENNY